MGIEGEDYGFVLTGVGEEVLFIFDYGFEACCGMVVQLNKFDEGVNC